MRLWGRSWVFRFGSANVGTFVSVILCQCSVSAQPGCRPPGCRQMARHLMNNVLCSLAIAFVRRPLGYTAAFVYGRSMAERGFIVSSASILRRAWQIYVAHIFLFVIYVGEISYVASSFENPLYAEEMSILDFLKQPDQTMIQALLLKFRPVNMDVLPLYIVLLLLFSPALWLLQRGHAIALSASVMLYVLAWKFGWNLPAYPEGDWYFNPFAWQLLFVFGAWCALGGAARLGSFLNSRITLGIALVYIAFSAFIALSW